MINNRELHNLKKNIGLRNHTFTLHEFQVAPHLKFEGRMLPSKYKSDGTIDLLPQQIVVLSTWVE